MFCCPTDATPNFRDLLAVVCLSHRAELTVRLDVCRKVSLLSLIYTLSNCHRHLLSAKVTSSTTMLFVIKTISSSAPLCYPPSSFI